LTALAAEALRRDPRSAGESGSVSRFGSRAGARPSGERRPGNLSNICVDLRARLSGRAPTIESPRA